MVDTVHGVPGQDGRSPSAVHETLRAEAMAYFRHRLARRHCCGGGKTGDGFGLETASGNRISVPRVVLASGVEDPDIPGLAER